MVEHHSGPLPLRDPRPGVTFSVDRVEPASEPLATREAEFVLKERLGLPVVTADPGAERLIVERDSASLDPREGNALADAVHLAFSQHRPLVLSPDAVWLTLAQGVAQHLRLHSERLRERLVEFQGKKRLRIKRDVQMDALTRGDWAEAIDQFATEAAKYVAMEQLPEMLCSFSTTTAASRAASQIVMLDGFRRYFDLEMLCICGFPQITVLGTPDDWRDILERTSAIERLGMGWWTERLRPILEQFVCAAAGQPNKRFWRKMYKLEEDYGVKEINGWFAHLFPYVCRDGALPTTRNPVLVGANTCITTNEIPNGLSQAPVRVLELFRSRRVELVAGLTGVAQDPETFALTPVAGWAVTKASRVQCALETIVTALEHRTTTRQQDVEWWTLGDRIPAELVEFYEDFEQVELFADTPTHCVVLHTPRRKNEAKIARGGGLELGRGPGGTTIYLITEYAIGEDCRVGIGLRRESGVDVVADSFVDFVDRVLAEGAYFERPDFQPLRSVERPR